MGEHEQPTFLEDEDPEGKWGHKDRSTGEYPPPALPGESWWNNIGRSDTISSDALMQILEHPVHDIAHEFLVKCGIPEPTPDAVGQLLEAFLPALRKMCDIEHPWDPKGATWRESGSMGALSDARKKFKRLWYRAWTMLNPHDDPAAVDSAVDLLNFVGFWLRSKDDGWNEWGEPGSGRG